MVSCPWEVRSVGCKDGRSMSLGTCMHRVATAVCFTMCRVTVCYLKGGIQDTEPSIQQSVTSTSSSNCFLT